MEAYGHKVAKSDPRICVGILYFESEEVADEVGAKVRESGITYNGGYMHGVLCGRDPSWDYVDETTGRTLYAVTH